MKLRENGLKLRDDHLQNINSLVIGGKISRTVGRSLIHLEIENGALVVKHEGKEDKSYLCATKRKLCILVTMHASDCALK